MTPRPDRERGASAVEFALVATVLFGCIGLALFAAHVYEVRSDLQRVAQQTARYATVKCDPRIRYSAGSGCATTGYPSTADLQQYAESRFTRFATTAVSFVELAPDEECPAPSAATSYLCRTLDPTGALAPSKRLEVNLAYELDTPFKPFLRLLNLDDVAVDLVGRGAAMVE